MKRSRTLFLLLLLPAAAVLAFYAWLPGFLAVEHPVEAGDVLLEAWIPSAEVERAVGRFLQDPSVDFFVVGRIYAETAEKEQETWQNNEPEGKDVTRKGIWLYANSSLGIGFPDSCRSETGAPVTFSVEVQGQEAGGWFAAFNLVVNGSVVGGGFSTGEPTQHSYTWMNGGETLESLYVRFNNDLKLTNADRNLKVVSVTIDGSRIQLGPDNTWITRSLEQHATGFLSQAEEVADYLVKLGVPRERISSLGFDPPEQNLTLAAALAFREFRKGREEGRVNVVSSGLHCRRTWITYRKTSGNKAGVGILNFHPEMYSRKNEYDSRSFTWQLADEFASCLLTWFVLTF